MARYQKQREEAVPVVEVPVSHPAVVTVEATRDYCGRSMVLRKGDQRLIPFDVAQKIITDHGDNSPIRIVKSLASPFNKAIQSEDTK